MGSNRTQSIDGPEPRLGIAALRCCVPNCRYQHTSSEKQSPERWYASRRGTLRPSLAAPCRIHCVDEWHKSRPPWTEVQPVPLLPQRTQSTPTSTPIQCSSPALHDLVPHTTGPASLQFRTRLRYDPGDPCGCSAEPCDLPMLPHSPPAGLR